MIEIRVRGTRKVMSSVEREKQKFIDLVAKDTKDVAVKNTPIDQGRARRGWRLEGMFREKRIVNRVPYIVPLENGHSKQAPRGILGPTLREISQRRYK